MAEENYAYDEDQALKFIRASLPEEIKNKYTDDEILYVIDCIWDYYESKGLLSLSADLTEEEELDVDQLTDYVRKAVRKDDELIMDTDDLSYIVKGELAYEESLDVFGD